MRPFISIDIETMGLDVNRTDILEIGYIADDLESNLSTVPFGNLILNKTVFDYADSKAIEMNFELIKKINNPSVPKVSPAQAFEELYRVTLNISNICHAWDVKYGKDPSWATKKVCFCGKNAATFDVPVLKNYFLRNGVDPKAVEHWMSHVHHRVMDVGSMYFQHFGTVPSLTDINKITGRADVKHRALEDALDVVYAVRHIMGVPLEGKKN